MPVINSLLDSDFYKWTMGQVVYFNFFNTPVKYKFINRNKADKFPVGFDRKLKKEILHLSTLRLTPGEKEWLLKQNSIYPEFVDWFEKYRFNPKEVSVKLKKGELDIEIAGPWQRTIFWEVPLLAIISELYFNQYQPGIDIWVAKQRMYHKSKILQFPFADFGTRRRFSFEVQNALVYVMRDDNPHFLGTSNPYFAMMYRIPPIGTYAHEVVMAMQALTGREDNTVWLECWQKFYGKQYSIMLTDTLTTDYFIRKVPIEFFRLMDGVRLDSGDPIKVGKKVLAYYKQCGINPKHKKFVWSDSLNPQKARVIYERFKDETNCVFGIGTDLTNDVGYKPLNMVIKLASVKGNPVVKLSDDPGKHTGDGYAIRKIKEYCQIKE